MHRTAGNEPTLFLHTEKNNNVYAKKENVIYLRKCIHGVCEISLNNCGANDIR